jgi:mannose-6-phosphate isomerase-like protein (cupin superfamily)
MVNVEGGEMEATIVKVLKPTEGRLEFTGSIGVRFMVDTAESGGGFSLVEHPMSARALAAPLHRHSREDEYSYVLEGRVGAQLGEEVLIANRGDLIFKPRNQWHTFWNAGNEPARILEIISPAGFEQFFLELAKLGGLTGSDPLQVGELSRRYGVDVNPDSIPSLIERHQLRFPGEPI